MKLGDLVTVRPARSGLYLIIGEDPNRENTWSDPTGIVLGRLFKLYAPSDSAIVDMHEKWIEVVHESR